MLRSLLALTFLLPTLALADDSPQTGSYTVSFTQHHPLSTPKTLAARLKLDKAPPEYDLASEQFLVHVPDSYNPAKPMGLVMMLMYKDATNQLNNDDLKAFDDRNIALITLAHGAGDQTAKAGEALDAVFNMSQRYAIDPTRTYLFYFPNRDAMTESIGTRLFASFPDVFTGGMLYDALDFWTPMKAANGGIFAPKVTPSPGAQYRTAGVKHPLVLLFNGPDDAFVSMLTKAWTSQGYKWVKNGKMSIDDFHYPNFATGWLTDTLDYLDQHKPPATKPTTAKTSEK